MEGDHQGPYFPVPSEAGGESQKEHPARLTLHCVGGSVCESLSILLCKILILFTAFGLLFVYLLIYAISGTGSPD